MIIIVMVTLIVCLGSAKIEKALVVDEVHGYQMVSLLKKLTK